MTGARGALAGRVALVTGASRGIGREVAKLLAAHGAHTVLAARTMRDGDAAMPGGVSDAVDEIIAAGGSATAMPIDLTRADERVRLIETVARESGPVDILVNNAAVTYFAPIAEFSLKRVDLMWEVQVKAPLHLIQLVLPGMRRQQAGWILNISSIVSRHPSVPAAQWYEEPNSTVYGLCKAGLERLTTGVALETVDDGIAVNSLSPNRVVATPGTVFHGLTGDGMPELEPIESFARAALRLCSAPPSSYTGRILCTEDVLLDSRPAEV